MQVSAELLLLYQKGTFTLNPYVMVFVIMIKASTPLANIR